MDTKDTRYRPVEFESRPGEWFNVLRLNLPVPRRFLSQRTSEHIRAGLRELRLAAASLLEEQRERVEELRARREGRSEAEEERRAS